MWRMGKSHQAIATQMGLRKPSVFMYIRDRGGIEPRKRTRSEIVLSDVEREEISRGLRAGLSLRDIARDLGRSPSTVSREVGRHGGRCRYRAAAADRQAWKNARRPKPSRLSCNERLQAIVSEKLRTRWSPEQIASWLKLEHSNDESLQVSHETIYKSLFIQSRGALKKELRDHLRTKRRFRQARVKTQNQRNSRSDKGGGEADKEVADRITQIPGVGQRWRIDQSQTTDARCKHRYLLLWSTQSLAARIKWKH